MSARALWLFPILMLCAGAVIGLGPYSDLVKIMTPPGTFDESPAKSVEDASTRIEKLGADGIALYQQHFFTDILFIALNLIALSIALLVILPRARLPRFLLLLPLGAAITDIVENLAIRSFLSEQPTASAVSMARYCTVAKMGCFAAAFGVILIGAGIWFAKGRKTQS